MAKTLLISGRRSGLTAVQFNETRYFSIGCLPTPNATEDDIKAIIRTAGTASNLSVTISINNVNNTRTFRTRINNANGSMSVAIPDSATGEFTDAVNTDSIAAGNTFNYQLSGNTGTGGTSYVAAITCSFNSSTVSTYILARGVNVNTTAAGTQYFWPPSGGYNTDELYKYKFSNAAIIKYFSTYIRSNTFTGQTTYTLRKNNADTACVLTVPASTSGTFEDTTNFIRYDAGDFANFKRVIAAGSGTVTQASMKFEISTLSGVSYLTCAITTAYVNGDATPRYFTFGGTIENNTNEPYTKVYFDGVLSNLQIGISANATTSASTLQFRDDGADSIATLSIPAGATGNFENNTQTHTVASGSVIGLTWTNGSVHNVSINFLGAKLYIPGRKRINAIAYG